MNESHPSGRTPSTRRNWSRLALGALVVAALAAGVVIAARDASDMALANGGFEDGLAEWDVAGAPGADTTRDGPRSGAHAFTAPVPAGGASVHHGELGLPLGAAGRVSLWVRSQGVARIELLTRAKARRPQRIAVWDEVPETWEQLAAPLKGTRERSLRLEIVATPAPGAPDARVWIDDVEIVREDAPDASALTADDGFADEPSLAVAADGTPWAAWLTHPDGGDRLVLARLATVRGRVSVAAAWDIESGAGRAVSGPRVVPTDDGVALVYAVERGDTWTVAAVRAGADGPSAPVEWTSAGGRDLRPDAVWHGGALHVAWETEADDGRRIVAAALDRSGGRGEPVTLSEAGVPSHSPSITALADGTLLAAWHAYRQANVDVFLRRRAAGAAWGAVERLTTSPSIDRCARLFAAGDAAWITFDHATTREAATGADTSRRAVVARVGSAGLESPAGEFAPFGAGSEAATLAFLPGGRVVVTFLRARARQAAWDLYLATSNGSSWTPPRPLSTRKGMNRRPGVGIVPGGPIVLFQTDDLPLAWADVDRAGAAHSVVEALVVPAETTGGGAPSAFARLREDDAPWPPALVRAQFGDAGGGEPAVVEHDGRRYLVLHGDLHDHTEVSPCAATRDLSEDLGWETMRDHGAHDFACVTDHGEAFTPYRWARSSKLARANDAAGRFTTFLGLEWTSGDEKRDAAHPFGFYGHRNLVLADLRFPRWYVSNDGSTPAQMWDDLRRRGANFILIPHQLADGGNVPTDWSFVDETAQPVAEVFQMRGSYEHEGAPRLARRVVPRAGWYLQDAWKRGVVIGVIASPDHDGGRGKACVLATDRSREAILDALRARRSYGTTGARITLDVRVDGHLMGTLVESPPAGPVAVHVRATCPADVARVEICRDGEWVHAEPGSGPVVDFVWTDAAAPRAPAWYYVRVVQADGELAWSSPVWLGRPLPR